MLGSLNGVHESPVKEATAETPVAHVRRQSCRVGLEGGGIRLRLLECRNSVQKTSTCEFFGLSTIVLYMYLFFCPMNASIVFMATSSPASKEVVLPFSS